MDALHHQVNATGKPSAEGKSLAEYTMAGFKTLLAGHPQPQLTESAMTPTHEVQMHLNYLATQRK